MLKDLIQSDLRPRYKAVVRAVIDGIAERKLAIGARLPPQRELAHQLGMAVATVGRAYAELEERGVVTSHVGRGTFIAERKPQLSARPADGDWRPHDLLTYRVQIADIPGAVERVLRDIAAEGAAETLLGFSPFEGELPHREALRVWLSGYGVSATPEQIVMTNGGQHATMAALSTITHPGQVIATEELTDPRMKAVASYLDRQLVGVRMDEDGMIPEALEELCAGGRRISAIYCTPRNQNPTNALLPLARRIAIAEIAERYQIPIIESDIYGSLRDDSEPPIFALAPGRTYFVASLGRIAGPGLKVGCLVSPSQSAERSRSGVGMSTGSSSRLQAEVAARWIRSGRLQEMMRWQQADLLRRVSLLSAYPILGQARRRATSPHIWLNLPDPWRNEEFVEAAAAHGVAIAATHSFVVGRREIPHAVRIVLGGPATVEDLGLALDRLEAILQNPPRPHGRSA